MQYEMETKGAPPPYAEHQVPAPPNPPIVVPQPVVLPIPDAASSAVMVVNQMGPSPAGYVCKSCNTQVTTRVQRTPTMRTHTFAMIFCVFGCLPCIFLPYCMDSCKNADHYCPNCDAFIGTYIN